MVSFDNILSYLKPNYPFTCSLPSSVLGMVTHLVGWAPPVVMAVIKLSSSSLFSFSFLTRDSIALLLNASLSPPCLHTQSIVVRAALCYETDLMVTCGTSDCARWRGKRRQRSERWPSSSLLSLITDPVLIFCCNNNLKSYFRLCHITEMGVWKPRTL